MRRPIELEPAEHGELRGALAGVLLLINGTRSIEGDQVGSGERLKFDRVRAGVGRHIDQFHCTIEGAVVIDTSLGDDEGVCAAHAGPPAGRSWKGLARNASSGYVRRCAAMAPAASAGRP